MRNCQRRHKQGAQDVLAREAIACGDQGSWYRNDNGQSGCGGGEPNAEPRRTQEIRPVQQRTEPACAESIVRHREVVLRRERNEAYCEKRRQHESDESRMKTQRRQAIAAHSPPRVARRSTKRLAAAVASPSDSSSAIDRAAPGGQFIWWTNSSYTSTDPTLSRRPPMIAGVAKALAAKVNTMMAPDKTPGSICGRFTRRNAASRDAPREVAAFSTCG